MKLSRLFHSSVNVLFPVICDVCGKKQAIYPLPICRNCKERMLEGNPPPVRSLEHLRAIWSCRSYEGAVMKCIRGFKYRGNLRLISVFEEIILNFLNENDIRTCSADLIVPVPLHPVRLYRRGYNQSELISNILSKHLSIPVSRHALVKTKNTVPQMGLPRKRRVKNLKNSFAVVDRLNLLGRSVMLVDDIMTTGATLDTCAQELTRSGVTALYGFTLARTM